MKHKTIFQLVEQDATEKQGVTFDDLFQAWTAAGQPSETQTLVDFLKSNAKISPEEIVTVFKSIGLELQSDYSDENPEVLTPESVTKIQKFLGGLNLQELQALGQQLQQVKVMSADQLKQQAAGARAIR